MKFIITLLLSACALLVAAAPLPDTEAVEIRGVEVREPQGLGGPIGQAWRRRSINVEERDPQGLGAPSEATWRREPQGLGAPGAQTWRREPQGLGAPGAQTWRRRSLNGRDPQSFVSPDYRRRSPQSFVSPDYRRDAIERREPQFSFNPADDRRDVTPDEA